MGASPDLKVGNNITGKILKMLTKSSTLVTLLAKMAEQEDSELTVFYEHTKIKTIYRITINEKT